jgi:hypothetical protein
LDDAQTVSLAVEAETLSPRPPKSGYCEPRDHHRPHDATSALYEQSKPAARALRFAFALFLQIGIESS